MAIGKIGEGSVGGSFDLNTHFGGRGRGDLIETFKILRGFAGVNPQDYFSLCESRVARGHPHTLTKTKGLHCPPAKMALLPGG